APSAQALLADFPHVAAWRARVDALGEGDRRDVTPAEALAAARDAEPAAGGGVAASEPNGLTAGAEVRVTADDYGFDPVAGVLVGATEDEIAIRRADPMLGAVVVHFPRFGFRVTAAA